MTLTKEMLQERTGPKYLAIVDAMAQAIRAGELQGGDRLPTHRKLARDLEVTVGTVTRAFAIAQERGLISGEVGRGTFVRHLPPAEFSLARTPELPTIQFDLRQNYPVPVGQVEDDILRDGLTSLTAKNNLAHLMASSWNHLENRHQAIGAQWIQRTGFSPARPNVFLCSGVQPTLTAIAAAACQTGDTILIPALCYPGIQALARQNALGLQSVPLDEVGIVPAALDAACRIHSPKLLYLAPTLPSPTVTSLTAARRTEIVEVARKHDLLIIEDDDSSCFLDDPLPAIASLAPERTFLIADTTRALSLGLRTTYLAVPDAYRAAMPAAIATTMWMASPLLAELAALMIEAESADQLIQARKRELAARNELAVEILRKFDIRTHPASHHLWLHVPPTIQRAETLVALAAQAGVGVTAAEWFALPGHPAPEAVRICLGVAASRPQLAEALQILAPLLSRVADLPTGAPMF